MTKGKGTGKTSREVLKPVDDRKVGKRKAASKPEKSSAPKTTKKDKKAKKDPNKPKRPPSAFFVFLEDFRKTFKAENPNVKAVSAVGKAGGEKWKSLTKPEKAPYEAKAAKRKVEYEKLMNAYNNKVIICCVSSFAVCVLIVLFMCLTFFNVDSQVQQTMKMRNQTSPNLKLIMKMKQVERTTTKMMRTKMTRKRMMTMKMMIEICVHNLKYDVSLVEGSFYVFCSRATFGYLCWLNIYLLLLV
ncbi:TOX high mobility group box family member 3 isoform X1 [Trifolium pratense]|uniref:TOX high mobility group box family member 3 isoform X1 n=1 Tax=Trifolium pratense TaxID=57577 RepID=UPI001E695D6D|nr:TOX high mobility group box family member 3 isoform X1 [Trifolium pratense]